MKFINGKAEGVKISYIGGGSRGWAWTLMSDLVANDKMSGDVYLYDIDYAAAKRNEVIGEKFNSAEGANSVWHYHASESIDEALAGSDFVIISILPGTFKEMESDVHLPEKYGIYQSVGDTSGPGGIVRALRTIPMFEHIARKIKENCPDAWVINYTNPMTLCVATLYKTFPEIHAFGCCHEVFGTQKVLGWALEEIEGIKIDNRNDIKVNPIAVNHFTWITEAKYKDMDLFPVYKKFCEKYSKTGYIPGGEEKAQSWDETSSYFDSKSMVKMDLFNRYGVIAAAGDRHLAEFCPGKWYLKNPEHVYNFGFKLTPVSWRWEDLKNRLEKSDKYINGEIQPKIVNTGEEGVHMMCALLGFADMITNVNIPNRGQIPNLPLGAVVETNAAFRAGSISPVMAGNIPDCIYPLVAKVVGEQALILEAATKRDLSLAFEAFCQDPLVPLSREEARELFDQMIENTKDYLGEYGV